MKKSKPVIKPRLLSRNFVILIISAAFCITGVAVFFGVQLYIKQFARPFLVTLETAPEVDAILVLGAFVHSDGRVSGVLHDRLAYALKLFEAGKAGVIIVSGDHGQKDYNEVGAMRNWLLQRGVPKEKIFMDHAGLERILLRCLDRYIRSFTPRRIIVHIERNRTSIIQSGYQAYLFL